MPLTLEALDLHHRFRDAVALDGVSLTVEAGTVTALVGESGCGKTTLLRTFNRMVDPDRGTVRVGGVDIRTQPPVALRRRIGYVPQSGGLLPHWPVRRNVALVPLLTGMTDVDAVAAQALNLVGLPVERFAERLPHQLSGGQRQRVALARALAAHQEVVLLDEPFGALDAISRADTHEAFVRVRKELGFTALFVTHDLAEASRLADLVVVMRNGRIEQCGPIDDLRRTPATDYVRDLFARAMASSAHLVSV